MQLVLFQVVLLSRVVLLLDELSFLLCYVLDTLDPVLVLSLGCEIFHVNMVQYNNVLVHDLYLYHDRDLGYVLGTLYLDFSNVLGDACDFVLYLEILTDLSLLIHNFSFRRLSKYLAMNL